MGERLAPRLSLGSEAILLRVGRRLAFRIRFYFCRSSCFCRGFVPAFLIRLNSCQPLSLCLLRLAFRFRFRRSFVTALLFRLGRQPLFARLAPLCVSLPPPLPQLLLLLP